MNIQDTVVEEQLHSRHYLRMVTSLGDSRPVYSTRDIYSTTGIKLLSAGSPVNGPVYEKLMYHKLVPKLDECLTSEANLDIAQIRESASALLESDWHLGKLIETPEHVDRVLEILERIQLNGCMTFKLTVMYNQNPTLFQHSLFITLVSIHIGHQAGLLESELVQLATAALLHDIGILHIDPRLLDRSYRMSDQERHHLYAHPLTAWMILREFRLYSGAVADAVLQHHERLDGSGYPRGLTNEHIHQFGQILAIAEIVASRHIREDAHYGLIRLETILKLNSRRYGRHLIGHLRKLYEKEPVSVPPRQEDPDLLRRNVYTIAAILATWESIRSECESTEACGFIHTHIVALRTEMLDAGVNLDTVESNILGMEESPRASVEARVLLEEILWRLQELLNIVKRRWPHLLDETSSSRHMAGWLGDVDCLLSAAKESVGLPLIEP